MKKFMVIYHASAVIMEQMMNVSPEQAKEGMDEWMEWAEKCGSSLLDVGAPLGNGKSITPSNITESSKEVCGYSIMQAESLDAVYELLKNHPHFKTPGSCTIEVHEELMIPGM